MKNNLMILETLTAKWVLGLCLLGSCVHVGNEFAQAKRKQSPFTYVDALVLLITSIFAGAIFLIISLMVSTNQLHHALAVSTGAFMGISGLNRVTELLIGILKKP